MVVVVVAAVVVVVVVAAVVVVVVVAVVVVVGGGLVVHIPQFNEDQLGSYKFWEAKFKDLRNNIFTFQGPNQKEKKKNENPTFPRTKHLIFFRLKYRTRNKKTAAWISQSQTCVPETTGWDRHNYCQDTLLDYQYCLQFQKLPTTVPCFYWLSRTFMALKKGFQSSRTFKSLKAFKAHRLSKGLSKLTLSKGLSSSQTFKGAFKLTDF